MSRLLRPGGLLLVDPWFEPGQLTHGWISTLLAKNDQVSVCRMARTLIEGSISRLEFEYLIGEPGGIRRASEVHELGLFTHEETLAAFRAAGFEMHYDDAGPTGRGLWAARPAAELDR
jgi:hypothetical protein